MSGQYWKGNVWWSVWLAFWAAPGKNGLLWSFSNKSQIPSANAYRWCHGYPIFTQVPPSHFSWKSKWVGGCVDWDWLAHLQNQMLAISWFMDLKESPKTERKKEKFPLNITSISYIFTISLSHRNKAHFIKRGNIKGEFLTFRLHFVRQTGKNKKSQYLSFEVKVSDLNWRNILLPWTSVLFFLYRLFW